MIIDWNNANQSYIVLSTTFNWSGGYVIQITISDLRRIFLMDTERRLFHKNTALHIFIKETEINLFHKDTMRRIFEKDTDRKVFMP